ncbi:MAG: TIGR03960 family B12-binding radical SAM protein [Anaerolineaceae bacterium]
MSQPKRTQIDQILYHVEKPGRYVGGEFNQISKPWKSVDVHVALAFPDIYDLGQPNLGLAILYDILNQQPNTAAERVYAPWTDMEEAMRQNDLPLFSLESKTPLSQFEIIGFTLPYESIYTNVLNMLDLAQIPLLSKDRNKAHPLIVAGGQACFNPEPMAEYIDAFVIGEGEEIILEIAGAYRLWRSSGEDKIALLLALAKIPGIYVPSFYAVTYHQGGQVRSIKPQCEEVPEVVTKRIVATLPPPITRFIVPNVDIVHDRIAIEIMRGCTRGCRFCHAGMVNRPVRERSIDEILDAIDQGLANTGYEAAGLLSLSSSDHTHILELIQEAYKRFEDRKVQISLPSLRIASFSVKLMDELKDLKPAGGFTLAPEAATERMRAVINKPLDEKEFLETVRTVFEHGWLSLKLYFMIGLPGETMEDFEAIATLSKKVLAIGKQVKGNRVKVHIGLGSFIPKPHTPFQWYASEHLESLKEKIYFLRDATRKAGIKLTYNSPDSTLVEIWLSRGDRRIGQVIYQAWKNGAKFDAWNDRFNQQAWLTAFETVGLDPDFYAFRQRELDELLPWEHISTGVRKQFLKRDLLASQAGETRDDCRNNCFYCGITENFADVRPSTSEVYWGCP